MTPVVRKVALKKADDTGNDLDYWLSKSPRERMAAVTSIVSQSLDEGQRLDKRRILKKKIKA
ncbi:hypothetical protein EXU57_23055 [Segetibacter sp. 3557_3]|nr:hypothetical protein EXU57_23055 [Segetibacter sp. 3557_3]